MIALWLLCVVSGWGASQHLSRVPTAQVAITNPGERGLIPAQPYWPPTPFPRQRSVAVPAKPPVTRHAHAHLNEIESGVHVQGHGYRQPPAGVSQPLPTVVLDTINKPQAGPDPPHVALFADQTNKSAAEDDSVSTVVSPPPAPSASGDHSTSSDVSQQPPVIHPRPISTVTHLPLTISSLHDSQDVTESNSVTSENSAHVTHSLGELNQESAHPQVPLIHRIQSHVPKTLQQSDPHGFKQVAETQNLREEFIRDSVTSRPPVVTTTSTLHAGALNNDVQNNAVPPQSLQAPDPLINWDQSVFGKTSQAISQVLPPSTSGHQRQNANTNFVQSQFTFKETNVPIIQDSEIRAITAQQQQPTFVPQQQPEQLPGVLAVGQEHSAGLLPVTASVPSTLPGPQLPLTTTTLLQVTALPDPAYTVQYALSGLRNSGGSSASHVSVSETASPLPQQAGGRPLSHLQQLPQQSAVGRPPFSRRLPYPLLRRPHSARPLTYLTQRPLPKRTHPLPQLFRAEVPAKNKQRLPPAQEKGAPQSSPEIPPTTYSPHRNHNTPRSHIHNQPRQQSLRHDPYGQVFEALNQKISKDGANRDYQYHDDDYYDYDYDDYYYDYEEQPVSARPPQTPATSKSRHKPYSTISPTFPINFSGTPPRLDSTTNPPARRARPRNPITPPPSFIPPRPGHAQVTQAPPLNQQKITTIDPFPGFLPPSHPQSSPTDPLSAPQPSFVSRQPPLIVHDQLNFPSERPHFLANSSSHKSEPTSPPLKTSSVNEESVFGHTTSPPIRAATRKPHISPTQNKENVAQTSDGGRSQASESAATPETPISQRQQLSVAIGTLVGAGPPLTVRVSPEQFLRFHISREKSKQDNKDHEPVYFSPSGIREENKTSQDKRDSGPSVPASQGEPLHHSSSRKRRRQRQRFPNKRNRMTNRKHIQLFPQEQSNSSVNSSVEQESPPETQIPASIPDGEILANSTQGPVSHKASLRRLSTPLLQLNNTGEYTDKEKLPDQRRKQDNIRLHKVTTNVPAAIVNKTHMEQPHSGVDETLTHPPERNNSSDHLKQPSLLPTVTNNSTQTINEEEAAAEEDVSDFPPPPTTKREQRSPPAGDITAQTLSKAPPLPPIPSNRTHAKDRKTSPRHSSRLPLVGFTGRRALTTYRNQYGADSSVPHSPLPDKLPPALDKAVTAFPPFNEESVRVQEHGMLKVEGWNRDLPYPHLDIPSSSAALSGLPFYISQSKHLGPFFMVSL